jgi:uncharacterized membrane protein YgcG
MLRCGRFSLLACLACGAFVPAAVSAAGPQIIDAADLFAKSTVEQATQKINEIQNRFQVEVVVETVPTVPANLKAQYEANREVFFRKWAVNRASELEARGIYVLICKEPDYFQIEVGPAVRARAFTLVQRDDLVRRILNAELGADAALLAMIGSMAATVESNLSQPAGGPPLPSKPWDLSGWICLAVGLVCLIWLTLAVFRPMFAAASGSDRGQP